MKKYRRVEIAAFRRQVTIGCELSPAGQSVSIIMCDTESEESIDPRSEEGKKFLVEAVSIIRQELMVKTFGGKNEC